MAGTKTSQRSKSGSASRAKNRATSRSRFEVDDRLKGLRAIRTTAWSEGCRQSSGEDLAARLEKLRGSTGRGH